jgi:hypothetical protein
MDWKDGSDICLKRLRRTTASLNKDTPCLDRDSNLVFSSTAELFYLKNRGGQISACLSIFLQFHQKMQRHHHLKFVHSTVVLPSPKTKFRHLRQMAKLVSSILFCQSMVCHAPSYSIYPSLFGSSPSSRSLWFPF